MSDAKFGCSSKRWAAVLSSRLKGGGGAAPATVLSAGAGGWNSVGLPATVDFAAFWATARGRRARARRILRLECSCVRRADCARYAALWTAPLCRCGKNGLSEPVICRVICAAFCTVRLRRTLFSNAIEQSNDAKLTVGGGIQKEALLALMLRGAETRKSGLASRLCSSC